MNTKFDLLKQIKETFEAEGLSFPYPHQVAVNRPERYEQQPGFEVVTRTGEPDRDNDPAQNDAPGSVAGTAGLAPG
jgi:hypothetical protein